VTRAVDLLSIVDGGGGVSKLNFCWLESSRRNVELELEIILSQMAQKPMLRGEVGARALRIRSDVRGHG